MGRGTRKMAKQIINTGTEPGNQGDGDSLRDAFIKTNTNFDVLFSVHYVTDTSLDHDDPGVEGTIAKALQDAGTAGGGLVLVGSGTFTYPNNTLNIPENVILKGVGRKATTLNVTGIQDGITLLNKFSGVESLHLKMPSSNSGDGIKIFTNYTHLRDLHLTGVGFTAWGINIDSSNVCKVDNVTMGIIGPELFTGNGIIFQISDPANTPFNFGDCNLVKVDITLARNNTTGISFQGPDNTNLVINNIMLSQVEVVGTGATGGGTGLHLRNSARITCCHVDLENFQTAILEESSPERPNASTNNVYISTFVTGSSTSYASSGLVTRRLFLGCDNLTPESLSDADVMLPESLWLNETFCRLRGSVAGQLAIDDGNESNGVRLTVNSEAPDIKPSSTSGTARLTLGRASSQGVSCVPGIILEPNSTLPTNPAEGTLVQFTAGVVAPSAGLYQLRGGTWVFIG